MSNKRKNKNNASSNVSNEATANTNEVSADVNVKVNTYRNDNSCKQDLLICGENYSIVVGGTISFAKGSIQDITFNTQKAGSWVKINSKK